MSAHKKVRDIKKESKRSRFREVIEERMLHVSLPFKSRVVDSVPCINKSCKIASHLEILFKLRFLIN